MFICELNDTLCASYARARAKRRRGEGGDGDKGFHFTDGKSTMRVTRFAYAFSSSHRGGDGDFWERRDVFCVLDG